MSTSFSPNEPFDRLFLLKGVDERRTKTGKPYLAMTLGTPEGSWEARVWDMGMDSLPDLLEGDPVQARGTVQLYQDRIQLIVDQISKVGDPPDPRDLYPASSVPESQLRADFEMVISQMEDPSLRGLMETMLADRAVSDEFFLCPAAITMHHARIGGLAEHSLSVCRLARAAASGVPWLDRDLLSAGSLLHDIGKVLEYEVAGDFRFTLEGKYLGHIVQGHSQVQKWISQTAEFPRQRVLDVLHIILSHHGQQEYGSPVPPITAEALVVHFADDLDAKLDMIKTAGEEPGTQEAFVRGLRRTFQFRDHVQDLEAPGTGGEEESEEGKRGRGGKKSSGQEELF